jgi:hypothetical protein
MCEFTEFDGLRKVYFKRKCEVCNGTGQVVQTNFEDITSSPERLAEFLETVKVACFDCASRGPYKSPYCPFADAKDDPYECNILKWLKEVHK